MNAQIETLIETSGKYAAIADLYSWSENYVRSRTSPFYLFLDLIGFTGEEQSISPADMSKVTGYIELDLIGNALVLFANLPTDCTEYIEKLLSAEAEG